MTPAEFEFLSGFIRARSGISLADDKIYLFQSRLVPVLSRHQFSDIAALVRSLRLSTSGPLADDVVDAMTTNETLFFRDRLPFDHFANRLLPGLLARPGRSGAIRIWSAAASTGQEAYSLAMLCAEARGALGGTRVEILGTDLSPAALARAESGRYTQFEVQRGLPIGMLAKYFTKDGDDWVISPTIRAMVKFRSFNLLDSFSPLGRFDLIFCRNVLIYFDIDVKRMIFAKLAEALPDDGALVLGSAETVIGITDQFTLHPELRGIYIKTRASQSGRR